MNDIIESFCKRTVQSVLKSKCVLLTQDCPYDFTGFSQSRNLFPTTGYLPHSK